MQSGGCFFVENLLTELEKQIKLNLHRKCAKRKAIRFKVVSETKYLFLFHRNVRLQYLKYNFQKTVRQRILRNKSRVIK